MDHWLNNEFCFYFDEFNNSMDEAAQEYASALMSNMDNENFDPDKARHDILTKYFPEVFHKIVWQLNGFRVWCWRQNTSLVSCHSI